MEEARKIRLPDHDWGDEEDADIQLRGVCLQVQLQRIQAKCRWNSFPVVVRYGRYLLAVACSLFLFGASPVETKPRRWLDGVFSESARDNECLEKDFGFSLEQHEEKFSTEERHFRPDLVKTQGRRDAAMSRANATSKITEDWPPTQRQVGHVILCGSRWQ